VRRPGKIVVIGLNYRDHAAEIGSPLPALPRFHLIPGSAVTSPGAIVRLPPSAPEQVDYEGELAVVIGRTGRDIPESRAWEFVAGGTVANDLSARDVQAGAQPALAMASPALAKGFDGFKPLGPALLTTGTLRAHGALGIRTEVNGVVRQQSSTGELIFSIPQLLSYVSSFLTLEAGDVLLTGTPGGTGVAEGRFLAAGDVVSVTVDHIGTLTNTVAAANSRAQEPR
jgi:2-keto-4-pentenoate hydratase/2-oxohepta-3-ene-1,7-dioic acid hydratase in catechol pathway